MRLRRSLLFFLIVAFASASTAADRPARPAAEEKKPGLVSRFLNLFRGGKPKKGEWSETQLSVALTIEPQPVRLSETRLLKVTLTLINTSKKLVQLEFPTSQRIEVLLKTRDGKLVEQWSQDQSFSSEPTVLTINPNERAEYHVEVGTREMVAGRAYVVQGFFPQYERLRAEKAIVPLP
ncbi:MAG: BsuPI-related putative proteinase inhibitor [Verrucomicrobiota bacterium]|nr:BsuPI-related putative proteinase inhibitor [Verrucomicrobiota bacterium]